MSLSFHHRLEVLDAAQNLRMYYWNKLQGNEEEASNRLETAQARNNRYQRLMFSASRPVTNRPDAWRTSRDTFYLSQTATASRDVGTKSGAEWWDFREIILEQPTVDAAFELSSQIQVCVCTLLCYGEEQWWFPHPSVHSQAVNINLDVSDPNSVPFGVYAVVKNSLGERLKKNCTSLYAVLLSPLLSATPSVLVLNMLS